MRVEVRNLSFSYDYRPVLRNVSLNLENGDFLVVVGNNGSGKSTLVKCILGINRVPEKKIFLDGMEINEFRRRLRIGYVPQKLDDFNYEFPITVNEIMHVSRYSRMRDEDKLALFDRMGILELQNENINTLSGGQLQRVFIARAMVNNPDLLILDEPTAGIDAESEAKFYRIVNDLNDEGVTVILISHDLKPGRSNFNRIMHLTDGRARTIAASEYFERGVD